MKKYEITVPEIILFIVLFAIFLTFMELVEKVGFDPIPTVSHDNGDNIYTYNWEFENPVTFEISSRETFDSHLFRLTIEEENQKGNLENEN